MMIKSNMEKTEYSLRDLFVEQVLFYVLILSHCP